MSDRDGDDQPAGDSTGSTPLLLKNVQVQDMLEGPLQFVKASQQLINRCTKPSSQEFRRIFQVVGTGFLIMGFIGFVVKLVHIPINNIIVCVNLREGDPWAPLPEFNVFLPCVYSGAS